MVYLRFKDDSITGIFERKHFFLQKESCSIHVYPHMLRHTMATRLLKQGVPTQSLCKLLGHQNLRTTQFYAQINDEMIYKLIKDAISSLEAIAVSDWPLPETDIATSVEAGGNITDGNPIEEKTK